MPRRLVHVSEQHTHFGTIAVDGDEVPNTADPFLDSSNTQLLLDDNLTLTLQLACSGDHKGLDTMAGESVEDTGITTVHLGPEIGFTWSSKRNALLATDFPVSINNTALQIVPDWRVRAAFTGHF